MAKNKTRIDVITVFDGELDATDVFVSLIAQKHSQKSSEESDKNNLADCPKTSKNPGKGVLNVV